LAEPTGPPYSPVSFAAAGRRALPATGLIRGCASRYKERQPFGGTGVREWLDYDVIVIGSGFGGSVARRGEGAQDRGPRVRGSAGGVRIKPTVLVDVAVDSPIMQGEVFGRTLRAFEIDSVQAVIDWSTSARDRSGSTCSPRRSASPRAFWKGRSPATHASTTAVCIRWRPHRRSAGSGARDGQMPEPLRICGVHQRPRRAPPKPPNRPRRKTLALRRAPIRTTNRE
jgi:hypothetical protein